MTQLFVGFWWIKLLGNHLFLSWTIYESIKCYLNEISYLNKSVKKNVSAWHIKISNVRSYWFKMPGSLPHIFFRIPYQLVKDMQKLFWIEMKKWKIIFGQKKCLSKKDFVTKHFCQEKYLCQKILKKIWGKLPGIYNQCVRAGKFLTCHALTFLFNWLISVWNFLKISFYTNMNCSH